MRDEGEEPDDSVSMACLCGAFVYFRCFGIGVMALRVWNACAFFMLKSCFCEPRPCPHPSDLSGALITKGLVQPGLAEVEVVQEE